MKKQKNMIIAGLILLLGAWVWYVWSGSEPEVVQQVEQAMDKPTEQAEKKENVPSKDETFSRQLKQFEKQATSLEKKAVNKLLEQVVKSNHKLSTISKVQQMQNSPIKFYGKVIDQHGNAVSGVKVHYTIAAYEGIISSGPTVRHYWETSGINGMFVIKDKNGERIVFQDMQSEGFEFKKMVAFYEMNPQWVGHKLKSKGSPANPVIFHAWKKTEAERLVFSPRLRYRYSFDSSPYTINLLQPESRKGRGKGDIIVSIWRDPNASRHDAGDWKISLESVGGGGLIETADTFMNEAPEEGYQPKIVISHKKSDNNYVSRADKKYYLKSRNGQVYASLEVQIRPYYNDRESVLIIKYWLNPNGSRNLQYDPSKRIRPR